MSINLNQNHVNKGSTLFLAAIGTYDGVSRLIAVRKNEANNARGGKWGQAAFGVAEIAASFFAGKAALK